MAEESLLELKKNRRNGQGESYERNKIKVELLRSRFYCSMCTKKAAAICRFFAAKVQKKVLSELLISFVQDGRRL